MAETGFRHRRRVYYAKLTGIFISAAVLLTAGSAAVCIRCHRAMYGTDIVLFDISRTAEETVITICGEKISFPPFRVR